MNCLKMSEIKTVKEFLEENKKEKCGKCEQKAVWWYAPGYSGKQKEDSYYCDDHVPRGCSCEYHHTKPEDFHPNDGTAEVPKGTEGKDWKWVEEPATEHSSAITKEDGLFVYLDEKGREYPCCEYWYEENGWDKD
jgi:hypothetical protein